MNELRKLLLQRAQFLDVLQSTGISSEEIPISLDPPPEDEEGREEELRASEPMMKGVRAVRAKHEATMVEYCRKYYEAKGEREPTRQALIPRTFEGHKKKLESALSGRIRQEEGGMELGGRGEG